MVIYLASIILWVDYIFRTQFLTFDIYFKFVLILKKVLVIFDLQKNFNMENKIHEIDVIFWMTMKSM